VALCSTFQSNNKKRQDHTFRHQFNEKPIPACPEGNSNSTACCCAVVQLRRSRAWFPCVDVPLAACPFELHFTVPASHMAVSCGQLVKQAWSDNGKSRTFHYKLSIATPPQDIALAVGKPLDAVN